MRALTSLAAPPVALALAACGASSLEVLSPGETSDASVVDAPAIAPRADAGTSADYCSGQGPPRVVGGGEAGITSACAGGLAQSAFRYALCTCEGLTSATSIATDSFDATGGGYDAGGARAGGGVGTNGYLSTNGTLDVGGALWVSDANGMTVATASAKGELHVAGRVASGPKLGVGGDAYVLGDVAAQGDLTIAGTLHQPAGRAASAGGTKSIGATATGSFTVPPACDCDPALLVDVAGYVEAYRASNDDAALGVDPRALENVNGAALTLALPCGRVFFTRVGGTAPITLKLAPGRTAIFVGGDLAPSGAFAIDAPVGSEVDLFVEANVVTGGPFTLGDATNPARARLWVGGSGTLNLATVSTLAGNVYAPRAELVLGSGPTTVFGAIFARRLSAQASLAIHYDESVLGAGASCGATAATCTSCHDCANQACRAGSCGACTDSSECCAPLVCQTGKCVADLR